jgi:protein SCO1
MTPRHAPNLRFGRTGLALMKLARRFVFVARCALLLHLCLATGDRSMAAPVSSQEPKSHPLLDFAFTNELGQPVTLNSFRGQALAITFFFTRCPIPDFCPRLSKNFAEASHQLSQSSNAPTNWHFLSISFDPEFDTPAILKAYGEKYHYDPARWSFITGPKDKLAELARLSNVQVEPDSGLFKHNFRTMIIDAAGRVQMVFPMGGDLSEAIVSEVIKAATARTNKVS